MGPYLQVNVILVIYKSRNYSMYEEKTNQCNKNKLTKGALNAT